MKQNDDTAFSRNFQEGNLETFNTVYKKYYGELCYFAWSLVGEKTEAEDIVSDSMVKLWKMRQNFSDIVNIKAFLFITVRNACFDHLRSLQRQNISKEEFSYLSTDNTEEHVLVKMIESELLNEIYEEIENLPKQAKTVFKMTYIEGLSTQDIAEKLNMTATAIRNNRFRAIEALRIALYKKKMLEMTFCLLFILGILKR